MIISDLYQTNISCSNYNPKIDNGNGETIIIITVKLEDFNKAPVTGKSVVLSVDKGYFKSVTGTGTSSFTNKTTKSVSQTTKSDGTISAVYVPSEWGLCTFSANNTKIQCNVKGYKLYTDSRFTIRYNEEIVIFEMNWQLTTDLHANGKWNALTSIVIPDGTGTVPDLRPPVRVNTSFNSHNVFFLFETTIDTNAGGILKYYNAQTTAVKAPLVNFSVIWRRK